MLSRSNKRGYNTIWKYRTIRIKSKIYIERNKNRDNEKKSEEIMNRNMIRRAYQNPFFEGQNYTNVIVDQGKYLTPLNSNNIEPQ